LKKAGIDRVAAVQTDGLTVYGTIPTDQARALAESLQRVYQTSRSALKFGADEALWTGKMTVVALSDPREFAAYMLQLTGRRPAPGATSATNLVGNTPFIVIGPQAGLTRAEFNPTRAAAGLMASVVLNKRAGTGMGNGELPNWLTGGFAQGMMVRADGDPVALRAYTNDLRLSVLGDPNKPLKMATLADSWTGPGASGNATVSAAFVEYLMARTKPAEFQKFLAAFQEVDGKPAPTLRGALAALPMKMNSMETDWKVWAAQQR
jgi:hypothetical protein